ncbi:MULTISPECIES: ABC transporter permease [Pseudonocardia]|uniref:Peptide/nickel transport system permease protein n=1 Tax=Pseudonocardia oroxyli TaxID=366584 RepID=A0A1G7UUA8_PSEOR|nr:MULTISPECIES: ABC transporter permease [Pseudonocardia]MCF7551662.1 ABC transporter permease [Pseudonocardia sp. WMMC193]SDG51122.1 peptide/nickel transport system permease protein [Pseudonocardia oroxyli]
MTSLLTRRRDKIDDLGGRSLTADALIRLRRNPVAIVGAVIVGLFVLVSIFAPLLAPHGPAEVFPELQRNLRPDSIPGALPGFPLGSDQNGRDFFSRLLLASRQTLFVGVFATLIGLVFGVLIGAIAGAFGGWVDTVLMRVTDVLLSIPSLLLAISIAALAARPSQTTVIIAVALVNVPIFARLLRGAMLAQRESDHVLAATSLGVRRGAIVVRHMLPNAMGPVIVQATLTLATSILDAAALSFLGLGDGDPARAEWGLMLANAQSYLDVRPALAFYPAIAIILVALGFTLLGEALREALDPKGRR